MNPHPRNLGMRTIIVLVVLCSILSVSVVRGDTNAATQSTHNDKDAYVRSRLAMGRQMEYTTVRLEAVAGTQTNVGTGFYYDIQSGVYTVPVIITCKHVVAGADRCIFRVTIQADNGMPDNTNQIEIVFSDIQRFVIQHPDTNIDLCAIPILPLIQAAEKMGKNMFSVHLNRNGIPRSGDWERFEPLQPIAMIGYPIGLWDSVNNLPLIREGITASDPGLDYNGKKEFVIDSACFPGSSGSPVFSINRAVKTGGVQIGSDSASLLGVLYKGPLYTVDGTIRIEEIPNRLEPRSSTAIPVNLGFVIRATALFQFEDVLNNLIGPVPPASIIPPATLRPENIVPYPTNLNQKPKIEQ
jgi:trypsin-like peptidase